MTRLIILLLLICGWISGEGVSSSPRPVPSGSGQSCHVNYKVYVYPLPPSLLERQEAARRNLTYHVCQKCIFEQFALEYIIFDYFTQFCGRTYNPEEADYFYLPIVRDLDYRIALNGKGGRASSPTELALLAVMEQKNFTLWEQVFQVPTDYYQKHDGADHILVMPAPVTNFRHQSNMRGFFHYMPQLAPPIFFNVEYSRSFVKEYPICSQQKNLVTPYPTTDAEFFSKAYFEPNFPTHVRNKLIFYHGGFHGSCIFIREALNQLSHSKYAIQRGDRKREQGFQQATFCPIPIGDSPSSKRMYDAMNFGCIPVLLSDDAVWAFSHQTGGPFDPSTFSIQLPQRIVQKSAQQLLESLRESNAAYFDARDGNRSDVENPILLPEINWGKTLPSGQSLFSLIEAVAQEETSENNTMDKEETSEDGGKQKKGNKQKKNSNSPVDKNPLIRLLLKISAADIRSLRDQALNVSNYYRFYEFNSTLTRSSLPLTASHTFPSGGAIEVLDKFLNDKKAKGVVNIMKKCEAEKSSIKHKYIGNYPCQKNRRLLRHHGADNQNNCNEVESENRILKSDESINNLNSDSDHPFWKLVEKQQDFATWNQLIF